LLVAALPVAQSGGSRAWGSVELAVHPEAFSSWKDGTAGRFRQVKGNPLLMVGLGAAGLSETGAWALRFRDRSGGHAAGQG
jgi:hypothetical protein